MELQALTSGVELAIETFHELTGRDCVRPLTVTRIHLFTDSMVTLNWLQSHSIKFEKVNRLSIFVRNRLNTIAQFCDKKPVTFHYCEGKENVADNVTRAVSPKKLVKSKFLNGLSYEEIQDLTRPGSVSITIPNPNLQTDAGNSCNVGVTEKVAKNENLECQVYDITRSSKLSKCIGVLCKVMQFINNLKNSLNEKFKTNHIVYSDDELRQAALKRLIIEDQHKYFGDIHAFFDKTPKLLRNMPPIVGQLNVFRDTSGILRVKSKF